MNGIKGIAHSVTRLKGSGVWRFGAEEQKYFPRFGVCGGICGGSGLLPQVLILSSIMSIYYYYFWSIGVGFWYWSCLIVRG